MIVAQKFNASIILNEVVFDVSRELEIYYILHPYQYLTLAATIPDEEKKLT